MKLLKSRAIQGFTLAEMLVGLAVSSLLFAALYEGATALNRAYAAADNYFSTHLQQIRIMDYLARDVKRSFSVTTSSDLQTVTCIMPNYVIQSGDPEALDDSTTIGQRRTPVVAGPPYKAVVDYGTRNTRTLLDGVTTNGSATLTSNTAGFTTADVGSPVSCTNFPAGVTISSRNSATSVILSLPATASGSGKVFSIYGDGNRTLMDVSTTNASTTLTSNTAYFTAADVGRPVVGTSIVAGTTIASVTNSTTAVLSAAATQTTVNMTMTIGGTVVVYTVTGSTITRTENGLLTTIASSTDQLLPQTTDWQLSNTEYTTTTVTFQPIFTMNGSAAQKSGTTVYSTAYLRNRRRGN
jgi:prepilin-type N-terminal cleavage/methylation domain-containing protein